MSRIDCSQTLNYAAEFRRMCDSFYDDKTQYTACADCPMALPNYRCTLVRDITQERIDIVQKWSDEHPQETMLERFDKMFPKAVKKVEGVPDFCPEHLGWAEDLCDGGLNPQRCKECWNRPYVEVV